MAVVVVGWWLGSSSGPRVVVVVVGVSLFSDGVPGGGTVVGKWKLWCGGRWVWVFGDWPLPSWQVDPVPANPNDPIAWMLVKRSSRAKCVALGMGWNWQLVRVGCRVTIQLQVVCHQ